MVKGYINSIQTLGAVDGPGVRFTVFLQGCNLRCGCCHNPDTWAMETGKIYTPEELALMAERYKEYFGSTGGITLSGGEPLLQAKFATELFKLCKEKGINTCLDTSGSILNKDIEALLDYTDRVLLDIKYTNDADYLKYVGCSLEKPLEFLEMLERKNIPVTLRQVVIPTLNDNDENYGKLSDIAKKHKNVDSLELLPFKKLCSTKYDKLGINFRFADFSEPLKDDVKKKEAELLLQINR